MLFFTSDLCFGNDLVSKERGFTSVKEHDSYLINRVNERVCPEDDLFVLGNVYLGTRVDELFNKMSNLNCKVHIITGDFDSSEVIKLYWYCKNVVEVVSAKFLEVDSYRLLLSRDFVDIEYLNCVYGNGYGLKPYNEKGVCVCTDFRDYYPVEWIKVREELGQQTVQLFATG